MKMGLSMYGVAVMDGSLYSRLYGMWGALAFDGENFQIALSFCSVLNKYQMMQCMFKVSIHNTWELAS